MTTAKLKVVETAPFQFDVNFAAPKPVEPEKPVPEEPIIPTIPLPDHEAALKVAEEKGYQLGIKDGQAQGRAGEEKRLADGAARVAAATQSILTAIDNDRKDLEAESATLALSIAFKLAEKALENYPLDEIENLISESLAPLRKTPHLVVRLHEMDVETITATVGKLAREKGFEGRFVVLGEPEFARGDCKIEWADGGIIRDRKKAEADLLATFQSYFTPRSVEPLNLEEEALPLIDKDNTDER